MKSLSSWILVAAFGAYVAHVHAQTPVQVNPPASGAGLVCHAGGVLVCLELLPDRTCRYACDFTAETARQRAAEATAQERAQLERDIKAKETELEALRQRQKPPGVPFQAPR